MSLSLSCLFNKYVTLSSWTDFQVNEIDVDGHVVELTGHEIPPPTATVSAKSDKRPAKKPRIDQVSQSVTC